MATSNGASKAVRKPTRELSYPFRETPEKLATIDFGTTHCSVTYLLGSDLLESDSLSELVPTKLVLDRAGNKRVPSCILFDHNGEFMYFGFEARRYYAKMDPKIRPRCHYFEHVKMNLQYDETVERNSIVSSANGGYFFLAVVIAHILHQLQKQLILKLKEVGYKTIKPSDFDWVITVPAIWKAKGKEMMREAGYRAGLCGYLDEDLPKVLPASGILPQLQGKKSTEKLSLALESESAAIHCRRKAKIASRDSDYHVNAKCYIVVDAGGGTVDIASHAVVGDRIQEIARPTGNFCGGITVNVQFSKFLQEFVSDTDFSSYMANDDPENKCSHNAELNVLLYTTFESQKEEFGLVAHGDHLDQDVYTIRLPFSFWKVYGEMIVAKGRVLNEQGDMSIQVEDEGQMLRFKPSAMAGFFAPTIKGIEDLLKSHLSNNKNNIAKAIDTIFWVGGFGGSRYLRSVLEEKLKAEYGGIKEYTFAVSEEPSLAVIDGATSFRCNPSIVTKRKADATYGIGCEIHFDPKIHLPTKKGWSKDYQRHKCMDIFLSMVEEGEDICTNEVFVTELSPNRKEQKIATLCIYSSPKKDVWYTTDSEVYKLGELSIDMAGFGLGRKIELVFDITHTELQVRLRTPDNETTTVIDFLSSTL